MNGERSTYRKPTRREFLKTSVGAGAVAAVALNRGVFAAGSDTIRIGLIGCGGRGTGAAKQALDADPGVKLVAVADLFEDRVQKSLQSLQKFHKDRAVVEKDRQGVGFDGYRKVIESDADAVLIACASRFHPTYALAALRAGKHVFFEKPHAIDPPGVRTVLEAAEEAKKRNLCLVSGLHFRYDPRCRATAQQVLDGAIGEITSIQVDYMRAPYRIIERDPKLSEIEWQYRNWYHFNWLSGDDVVQSLIHTLDRGQWVMKDEPPVWAHGLGGRSQLSGVPYGNCFDHHCVVWEYASGVRMYGFNRTQYNCVAGMFDVIHGTKGRASLLGGWVKDLKGNLVWKYSGPRKDGHAVEQQEFMAALRAGKVINNGLYAARSTMTAIMGQLACYTGKMVTWEAVMKSDFTYEPKQCDFSTDPPVKPDAQGNYPVFIPGVTKLL